MLWLKHGDDNTSLFHRSIKQRRIHNRVNTLLIDGCSISDPLLIQQAFQKFYTESLLLQDGKQEEIEYAYHSHWTCSQPWSLGVAQSFLSPEEIKNAIWSIPDDKAPGFDGYNSKFFKSAWSIVGEDVIAAIQDFFATGKLLKSWNITSVTLIPKVACPAHPGDYRPISCCHVLYKCISKLICSSLKTVLGFLINQAQGAFVTNRSILHNVLLCQDIVKHYSRKHSLPGCLLKIDLHKAYDTMDWSFI